MVALAVGVDLAVHRLYWMRALGEAASDALRVANGVTAMVLVAVLLRTSRVDMGLRLGSDIPWSLVLKWGLRAAAAFIAMVVLSVLAIAQLRGTCALRTVIPPVSIKLILTGTFIAPMVEEPLYRGALCPAAHSVMGRRGGIFLCGVVFGGLHVFYGNPGITNLAAGFLFGWLFYWSRSLIIPSLVHGVGNGLLFGLQYLTRWYFDLDASC